VRQSLLPLVIVLLVVSVLQIFGMSRLSLFGVSPDMVTVMLSLMSVYIGQRTGMAFGFAAGLIAGLFSGNLGVNLLFRTIEGFTAGYFHVPEESHATKSQKSRMLYLAIVMASFAGNLVFNLIENPLGQELLVRIFANGALACVLNLLLGVIVNRLYLRKTLSE